MGITIKCYGGAPGNRGASLFPEGRTYSPPEGAVVLAVGKPCALRGGLRLLRKPPDNATAPAGAAVISLRRSGNSVCDKRSAWGGISTHIAACLRKPATGSFAAEMDGRSCPSIFSFAKEKQKKAIRGEARRWQFIIWKRRWSAGAQDAPPWPPPLI